MESVIEQLRSLDLDLDVTNLKDQLETLVVDPGEISELGEMLSKLHTTKAVKARWAAWNRQRKWCNACRSTVRRGGWSDHKTTKKHKRNARRLKRRLPKANKRSPNCTGSLPLFFALRSLAILLLPGL